MARPGSSPVLIGRTAELDRLRALFDQAAAGERAGTTFVLGEAGIGKSRLVDELITHVRAGGGRTLVGRAMEIDEMNLPYVPLLEALRPLVEESVAGDGAADEAIGRARPELARLFPELGPTLASDGLGDELGLAQTRLFGQLLGVFGRLGRQRPLLLVLEDLQWADRSTRELVGFLGRTLHSARVLLVVTVRSDALHSRHPLTPFLAELGSVERVSRIQLDRLTREEHDAQVAAILGPLPSADLLAQTYARSDGNPFYTEELIAPGHPTLTLSTGLRDLLLARARGLSERTRGLLRTVAVGWSVEHPLLEAVAALPSEELLESLREAVDRAILATDPASARYRFRHPLIAEAIYEDLLPGERIRIHAAYAAALERLPSLGDRQLARAAAELANHWLRAGEERRALPALVTAARAAHASFAQAEAFGHLERALAILEVQPDAIEALDVDLLQVTRLAAEAAEASGDFARAVELWERAVTLVDAEADPVAAGLIHSRAGEAYWLVGDRESLTRHRRRAVELVPAQPPSAARSWVLSRLASALVMGPALAEARPLAEEATAVARAVEAVVEESRAVAVLGVAQLLSGDADGAVASLTDALAISTRLGRLDDEAIDRSNLAEALHEAGRMGESLDVLLTGIERVQAAGLHHTYGETTNAIAVERAFMTGDWGLAARLAEEGLARAPRGLPQVWLALAIAELEAARGNEAAAREALATVDGLSTEPRITGWTGPHEQRASAALWSGRPAEALVQALAGLATLDATGLPAFSSEWRALCVRGLRAIGDLHRTPQVSRDPERLEGLRVEADALAGRFERHHAAVAEAFPVSPHLAADRLQVLAEYGRATGNDDPLAWAAAADAWSAMDHRFDLAVARWHQAGAALAQGGSGAITAAPALREAHRLARGMGALPLLAEVEALARRGRISLDEPAVSKEPFDGMLTSREREVLALVAAGRSNREIAERLFITAKTASVHVTNIKGKLGVDTRIEAATLAVRMGFGVDEEGAQK